MDLVALYLHQNFVFGAGNGLQDGAGLHLVLQGCGYSAGVQPVHFKVLYQSHLEVAGGKMTSFGA